MRLAADRRQGTVLLKAACAAALLALAACGGGGGGSGGSGPVTPTTPVEPPVDPLQEAVRTARLTGSFDAPTRDLTLRWTDGFTDESSFRIERLDGSDWVTIATVPAAAGKGNQIEWTVPYVSTPSFRVSAIVNGIKYVLKTVSGADAVSAELPLPLPKLLTPSSTVQGLTSLALGEFPAGASVRYSIDYKALGETRYDSPYKQDWDTRGYSNGTHVVQAFVQVSQDQIWALRNYLVVENPGSAPGIKAKISTSEESTSTTVVTVSAPSEVGTASVQFWVDGELVQTLTRPYGCETTPTCPTGGGDTKTPPWLYRYKLLHTAWPNGSHVVRGVVVDNAGGRSEVSMTVWVNAPPVLKLSLPLNYQIVTEPTLRLKAQVSDDLGPVDFSARVFNTEVARTTASTVDQVIPFNAGPDNVLQVGFQARAADSQGKVTIERPLLLNQLGSAFRPQAMLEWADALAADKDGALVSWEDKNNARFEVLRVSGSAESGLQTTVLEQAGQYGVTEFSFSGGWAAALAAKDLGGTPAPAIHAWGPDGKRSNLSADTGTGTPASRAFGTDNWVAWMSRLGVTPADERYTLRHLTSGKTLTVQPPVGGKRLATDYLALVPAGAGGSEVQLFFTTQQGGLYRFDSASGTTLPLSPAGVQDTMVLTDGQRIAWIRQPEGTAGIQQPFTLVASPASDPTASTVVSDSAWQVHMADGMLAWRERGPTSSTIKVYDGTRTWIVTQALDASLWRVGAGAVAYFTNDKFYLWTPAEGSRQVLQWARNGVSFSVGRLALTPGWMYVSVGNSSTLHRIQF